ncbi:response regulator [Candidatus Desantisbacteria bacterium]|nr:response regulator [Candidatus Desantisbacteria bacterium]
MHHILIIEDNPDDIIIAKRILSKADEAFVVETAMTGKEAIEKLDKQRFDCLLIDHMLPDTNALELLKHVRKVHRGIPAIVLTGLKDGRLLDGALKLGAVDFLTKDNIHGDILPNRILDAINSGQRSQFLEQTHKHIYEGLIDSMGEGLFAIDLTETIVLVNRELTKILMEQESNLLGKPCSSFMLKDEAALKTFHQEYSLVKAGQNRKFEIELLSKIRGNIPVLITLTPLFDENNIFNGALGLVTDLTEIKEMQRKLIEAERFAMVAKTASEVAHEVRNPLSVINNTVYLLKEVLPHDETIEKHLHRMEHQVHRIDSYFNDLLNLSKPLTINLIPADINILIEEALNELPQPIFSGIELIREFDKSLPKINIDHDKMRAVFINLIKNACEIMNANGRLRIKSEKIEEFIQISFEDTGPGILTENIKGIFEPFFTTRGKGTGLGLSICKRFVSAHHGNIAVKTELGKGCVFVVRLPIQ